jgi:hypothetical protein
VSRAVEDAVSGRTETGFQAVEPDDERRARKYDRDELRASVQAASSLESEADKGGAHDGSLAAIV